MSMHLNGQNIKELYYNGQKIKEAYYNGEKVYSSGGVIIFESSTAGTYTVELSSGKYEITCVAGGGGGTYCIDNSGSRVSGSGASGSCFKGVVRISAGTYTVVVGAGGIYASRTGYVPTGGASSINGVVSCPSQNRHGTNATYYATESAGAPTITATIISEEINRAGNNGRRKTKFNPDVYPAVASVYDNTTTGYGAGGASDKPGVVGYVKIFKL